MCNWTAVAKGLVGYQHTPTAPKMGARTEAMAATKSSTSARVRSAICCGKGNPAVSRGICWSELCNGWDWSTPTNRPEANTKVEYSQCWTDAHMRSNWRNNLVGLLRSLGVPNGSDCAVALVLGLSNCRIR